MAADSGAAAKAAEGGADAPAAPRTAAAARSLRLGAVLVVLVLAAALPLFVSGFRLFQFTQVLIYAIALLGLNLLTGYNGQFSLGHGAFYGIGAYTSAIMVDRWGIGYGWTIPTAGLVCLIVGFLFGRPALRLEGLYLALATFSLAAPRASS
jgi:branched-chain amino acid transport system permease protein